LIDGRKIKAALTIPSDYSKLIASNKVPETQLIIDGTDPTTARTALNSGKIVSDVYSFALKEDMIRNSAISIPGVNINTVVWFNPNMDSRTFTIPGLVGLILQNITVMLTAFALVREKERGTIEQLIVTPITSIELIFGKLIPYIFIGYFLFLFTLIIAVFWFGIKIVGSIYLLLTLGLLYVICSLLIGILISTISKNQLQAMMASMLFVLPSFLLTGFVFPRESMPPVIQALGAVLPLTYFLNIVRDIILKGVGFEFLLYDILALVLFTFVICIIAVTRFKKKLD
jgi:ABC-2 type transport system permease protein